MRSGYYHPVPLNPIIGLTSPRPVTKSERSASFRSLFFCLSLCCLSLCLILSMEAFIAPLSPIVEISPQSLEAPFSSRSHQSPLASTGPVELSAPPRMHYAPGAPGIQQSQNGDLSILSFEAVDDYLTLDGADVVFTLQNSGVAAADSFTVDVLYSEDGTIGNSDDTLLKRIIIDEIGAEDTLTRTENIQIADSALPEGEGFLGIEVDTNFRVVETDESNNISSVLGIGIDSITVGNPPENSADIPDESVLTQGGSYSTNVGLSASLALPGTEGVDVVLTESSAITAVNTETGSSLHWINPETGAIAQTVDFDSSIGDIAFNGEDVLAIAAGNELLKVDATTGSVISTLPQPSIDRVAISDDGFVGAISDRTVYLYDQTDTLLFSKTLNYKAVTDIEIRTSPDDVGGNSVYVTSFRNEYFTDIQGERNPVQIAKLEAFDFTGEQQWKLFGDESETIKQNVADTRLYRTTLGKDGYLYIGGESAGTATIFRWRGQPMTTAEQFGDTTPFLSQIDRYSQLYNSGAAHISYYARVNPITGELVHSQLTFPRLTSGKSNTMRIGDIATSDSGTLYFGGSSYSLLKNRNSLTINDQPVGSYVSQDPTWMSIAPDFSTRNFWTALSAEGASGIVRGVDAGYGYSAAISNLNSGTYPVTVGPNAGPVFISFTPEPRRE